MKKTTPDSIFVAPESGNSPKSQNTGLCKKRKIRTQLSFFEEHNCKLYVCRGYPGVDFGLFNHHQGSTIDLFPENSFVQQKNNKNICFDPWGLFPASGATNIESRVVFFIF